MIELDNEELSEANPNDQTELEDKDAVDPKGVVKQMFHNIRMAITGRTSCPTKTTFVWKTNIKSNLELVAYLRWLDVRERLERKRLNIWLLGTTGLILASVLSALTRLVLASSSWLTKRKSKTINNIEPIEEGHKFSAISVEQGHTVFQCDTCGKQLKLPVTDGRHPLRTEVGE